LRAMVKRVGGDLDVPLNVRVIDWRLQNAFALPGGTVVLTRGLLTNADSATEVAGVLAHEIGHVVNEHPETGLVRALGFIVAAQFIFAGGSETIGNIGTAIVALRFNRAAEVEADGYGLALMQQRAIDPRPLAGFFRRLTAMQTTTIRNKKRVGDSEDDKDAKPETNVQFSKSLEWLSTHPATAGRISRIEAAPEYTTRPVLDPSQWAALRSICGAVTKKKPAE
ncbi:MAG: M48 family metallopeptidase, partial [Pseudomonadota bacterium]